MKNYILLTIIVTLIPITIHSYSNRNINNYYVSTSTFHSYNSTFNDEDEKQIIVRLKNPKTGLISLIELEEYIIGVVSAEMPASFNIEALKAQAIAARTYALSKMNDRQNKNYDLEASTNDQAFISVEEMKKRWGSSFSMYYEKIKNAVNNTDSMIVTLNKKIVPTYYFAISNGNTQDAKSVFGNTQNYLVTVESKWDNANIKSYKKEQKYTVDKFKDIFNIKDKTILIKNIIRNSANYVDKITINEKEYTGNEIRKKMGLRSNDFTFYIKDNYVIVTTYGYGHGVGMSQYGANGMAKDGYSYDEILKYYYQNIEILTL